MRKSEAENIANNEEFEHENFPIYVEWEWKHVRKGNLYQLLSILKNNGFHDLAGSKAYKGMH